MIGRVSGTAMRRRTNLNQEGTQTTMWERMTKKRNEGGFTLIELLIVIIILAILAAIVVFAVGTTGSNAKTSACAADAKTFETALESYKAEVGSYPGIGFGSTWAGQPAGTFGLLGNTGNAANGDVWTDTANQTIGPFIRQLPNGTSAQHYQIVTDGNGGVFVVPASSNGGPSDPTAVPAQPRPLTAAMLTTDTVGAVSSLHGGDTTVINFDTDPAICQDNNVLS